MGASIDGHSVHNPERLAAGIERGVSPDPDGIAGAGGGIVALLDIQAGHHTLEKIVHAGRRQSLELLGIDLESGTGHIGTLLCKTVTGADDGLFKRIVTLELYVQRLRLGYLDLLVFHPYVLEHEHRSAGHRNAYAVFSVKVGRGAVFGPFDINKNACQRVPFGVGHGAADGILCNLCL